MAVKGVYVKFYNLTEDEQVLFFIALGQFAAKKLPDNKELTILIDKGSD